MDYDGRYKVKMKRQHQGTPYDRPKSLFKSVTDRVSSIIPQSTWLTKWFSASTDETGSQSSNLQPSSVTTSNTRPSSNAVRREDLNVERQRCRIPLPHVQMNQRNLVKNTGDSTSERDGPESLAGPSGLRLSTLAAATSFETDFSPGQSGFQSSPNLLASTPAVTLNRPSLLRHVGKSSKQEGDDHSDSSESTSGCSSMFPHPEKNQDSDLFHSRESLQNTAECEGPPTKLPRRSFTDGRPLFSSDTSSLWASRGAECKREPTFNASSFGSPVWGTERSIIQSAVMSSPFYVGRTAYGGAANYKRHRNRPTATSTKERIQIKPASNVMSDTSGMSTTTKRILDMLDRLSTPVLDAKRIPLEHVASTPQSSGINRTLGPPTQTLTIPTVPQLLKRRKTEADTIKPPVRTKSKDLVLTNKQTELRFNKDMSSGKVGGKVPSSVKERLKKQAPYAAEQQSPESVVLPNIPLPITSLPKFDDSLTTPQKSILPTKSDSTKTFKFSSPIPVNESNCDILPAKPFMFSQPLSSPADVNSKIKRVVVKGTGDEQDSKRKNANNIMFEHKVPTQFVPRKRTVDEQLPNRKTFVSSEVLTGSVMDVFDKKTNFKLPTKADKDITKTESEGFGDVFKLPPQSLTKSAPCETHKPVLNSEFKDIPRSITSKGANDSNPSGIASRETKPQTSSEGWGKFADKFKSPSGSWECQSCLVRNSPTDVKCLACETPKQGAVSADPKQGAVSADPKQGAGYADIVKSQAALWTCKECWTGNKSSADKCEACGTIKVGTKSDDKSKVSPSEPKFTITSSGFQLVGASSNKNEKQSGTDEPQVLNGEKGFTFGTFPASPALTKPGGFNFEPIQSSNSAQISSSPGFTFGTPKDSSGKNSVEIGFTFGEMRKSESHVDKSIVELSKSESIGGFKATGEQSNSVPKSTGHRHSFDEASKVSTENRQSVCAKKNYPFSFTESPAESKAFHSTQTSSIFSGKDEKTVASSPSQEGLSSFQSKHVGPSSVSTSQFGMKLAPSNPVLNANVITDVPKPVSETSIFQFGSGTSEAGVNQQQVKPFAFGGSASADEHKTNPMPSTNSTTNLFSFGAGKAPSTSAFGPPSGGFNFKPVIPRTEQPSINPLFGVPAQPASNLFVFGGGAPATSASSSTNFSFGAPKEVEPSPGGTFQFVGSNAQGPPPANFSFGASSAVPVVSEAFSTPAADFNFNSSQHAPGNVFNFGASQNTGAAFLFGQTPQQPSSSNTSGFNFKPNLNFTGGENAQFSNPPLQMLSAASQGRKIKRATRRNPQR